MIRPILGCVDTPTPVSVNELAQQNLFNVFPNPAQDYISITSSSTISEKDTVTILSAMGQTVLSIPYVTTPIDISSLANGIYSVHLSNNTLNISPKKLIIAR